MQATAKTISKPSHSFIPLSKRVFVERYDAAIGSKSWKRLFAASSAPSESSDVEKRRSRVSKQERREMLEAFVERYRASNAGKFPSIDLAQKEIGGSFYVLRQMIQELKYNHNLPPLKIEKSGDFGAKPDVRADMDEYPLVINEEADGMFEVKAPLVSVEMENPIVEEPKSHLATEINHSSNHILEIIETSSIRKQVSSEGQPDTEVPKKDSLRFAKENLTDTIDDSTESQAASVSLQLVTEVDSSETPDFDMEGVSKDKGSVVDSSVSVEVDSSVSVESDIKADIKDPPVHDIHGNSEGKSSVGSAEEGEQRSNEDIPKPDNLTRDICKMSEEGASSPKKSSIWENIRSLAGGIINLWRK